jgi:hypothetical protein
VIGEARARALLAELWETDRLAGVDYDSAAGAPVRAAG